MLNFFSAKTGFLTRAGPSYYYAWPMAGSLAAVGICLGGNQACPTCETAMAMSIYREHDFNWASGATRVLVGTDLLDDVGGQCRKAGSFSRVMVVTDEHLTERYAPRVMESLSSHGYQADLAVVPEGDASKSVAEVSLLYDRLADFGVARDGLVVAVGGGMVTDLAGFVGATWMRGIATALCPTTLQADIDAAIGGKTGVNHPASKNLIGAFHHPRLVIVDTACLNTLSQRDLAAGMAESIKHAVITGEPFTAWHEQNVSAMLARDDDVIAELIDRNVVIKADIVSRDERETSGARAVLNFGHTIGHAIETVSGYRLRHGECVSVGMAAACRLSQALGLLADSVSERIVRLLVLYGLPVRVSESIDRDAIWASLQHDKKVRHDSVRFVLLKGLGQPVVESKIPEQAVRTAIASVLA